nr:MAG TPA: hypothetical protein [Caudoviricetes sp.]
MFVINDLELSHREQTKLIMPSLIKTTNLRSYLLVH